MAWPDNREAVFLRVDETAPIDMVLVQGDVAISLAGLTELGLILTPQDGSADLVYKNTDNPAYVSVLDGANGKVRFEPNENDLVTGMVRLLGRWYTILAGNKFYFPQEGFIEFNLLKDPSGKVTNQLQIRADGYVALGYT